MPARGRPVKVIGRTCASTSTDDSEDAEHGARFQDRAHVLLLLVVD
jgi:hypothetical protein